MAGRDGRSLGVSVNYASCLRFYFFSSPVSLQVCIPGISPKECTTSYGYYVGTLSDMAVGRSHLPTDMHVRSVASRGHRGCPRTHITNPVRGEERGTVPRIHNTIPTIVLVRLGQLNSDIVDTVERCC